MAPAVCSALFSRAIESPSFSWFAKLLLPVLMEAAELVAGCNVALGSDAVFFGWFDFEVGGVGWSNTLSRGGCGDSGSLKVPFSLNYGESTLTRAPANPDSLESNFTRRFTFTVKQVMHS